MRWSKREKEIDELYKKCGKAFGRGKRRKSIIAIPNYKVNRDNLSNDIPGSLPKRELPDDAIQFPVGHSHKQGLELITPATELKYMSGNKT